uniref:Uncharacterized protein n=2 Tax=Ixodes scapularis TaxID=6945 RepID=A0A1S4KMI4_IXOSC
VVAGSLAMASFLPSKRRDFDLSFDRFKYNKQRESNHRAFRLSFAQTGTVTALSPVTVTSNSVVLSWNQPSTQVDGYEVRLSRGSSLVFVSRFELSAADKNRTTLFYGLESLMPGVTYNFSVAAIAGSQTGSFVSVLFTTPRAVYVVTDGCHTSRHPGYSIADSKHAYNPNGFKHY